MEVLARYVVPFSSKMLIFLKGWLRSNLDPSIIISKEADLNRTSVKVVVYKGSVYDDYVKSNLQAATIIRTTGNFDSYNYVLNSTVHIMLADAVDLYNWLKDNSANCQNCSTKAFSDPFYFGSFTSNNIVSLSVVLSVRWEMTVVALSIVMYFIQSVHV